MVLNVTLERMLCAKKESSWYFFRAVTEDGKSLICKGSMCWEPRVMETLALSGEWIVYKGERQFQFSQAKLALPLDERDQLHYVCTRTAGVGPSTEEAIWAAKGKDWRSLAFGDIKKVTSATIEEFRRQVSLLAADAEKAETISFLENVGCSEAMAGAAWEKWGAAAAGMVSADCYCLAELPGFSFKTVDDNIRRNFSIADEDPRRIRAAIMYVYLQECSDGSTVVDAWRHLEKTADLLRNIGKKLICECAGEMIRKKVLQRFEDKPYISAAFHYAKERTILDYIELAAAAEKVKIELPGDEELAAGEKFTPDESQLAAVKNAIRGKISIVNGGAGVGKTTVIKMIYRGIRKCFPELQIKLCAPTGKAAARLKEASGIPATTIHVMLGAMGNDLFSAGPLNKCAVIVDESSMVDSALLAEILSRQPAKIVLVGDQAQLTPVGNGQPFHDIIALFPGLVNTLTKCYRNTEAVFQAANKIRSGNLPRRAAESENEKWTVVNAADPAEAQELICEWAKADIIDFEKDIVLCPKNGKKREDDSFQEGTVNGLNAALLAIDREKRGAAGDRKFIPGDRVINTVNMPEAHVWNGTTGTVCACDSEGLFVTLDVPFRDASGEEVHRVRFSKEMAKNLRYAYALTVHKSQGSQYRKVFVLALPRDKFQLDRSLLYTGVTRTREECVVVGDYSTLADGINVVREKKTVLQCLKMHTSTTAG